MGKLVLAALIVVLAALVSGCVEDKVSEKIVTTTTVAPEKTKEFETEKEIMVRSYQELEKSHFSRRGIQDTFSI